MIALVRLLPLGLLLAPPGPAARPAGDAPLPSDIASMTSEEAERLVKELSPFVEGLRGLEFKSRVPVRVVDDAATRVHMKARIGKFWPERQRRAEQEVWRRLGLLPASGSSVVGTLLSVLEEQAGGFYDPDQNTFFLLADMPRAVAPLLMVHELTHALDDQHYGIDGLLDRSKADHDRTLALGAVVEGSGMVVMTAYLLDELEAGLVDTGVLREFQQTEAGRARKLRAAPQALQTGLLAPYFLGQTFLLRGRPAATGARVSGADLDRAFRDPPESSEQLLHPEKYWDEPTRDRPRPVPLADLSGALGRGWSLGASGTLGELYLAILTGAGSVDVAAAAVARPAAWTNAAATGWGGDLWQLYERGDSSVALLGTLWDTGEDAEEFEAALAGEAGRLVLRRGDAVVLVTGDDRGRLAPLGGAALDILAPPVNP